MYILKYFMLLMIFIASSLIGKFISKKYSYRLEELEKLKNSLNIFKTKIKFTYEPIPEIFNKARTVYGICYCRGSMGESN